MKIQKRDSRSRTLKLIKNDYDLYLMIVPMLVCLLLFTYRPLTSLVIAFKDYSPFKGIWASPWCGFKHFKEFFSSHYAYRIIKNTLVLGGVQLFLGFPLPIIFALLIDDLKNGKFRKGIQTINLLPHFISTVIVCSMVLNFLSPTNGVINSMIVKLGGNPVYFMGKPQYFVPVYYIMTIWRQTGYNSIIYISALTAIDGNLYEAATVDGAGKMSQLFHITLPELKTTIIIMFIIQLGSILNVSYESIILLYNPSIYETADVISSFVYRVGMQQGRYDYSTAADLMNSLLSFLLVVGANKISKKVSDTSLW